MNLSAIIDKNIVSGIVYMGGQAQDPATAISLKLWHWFNKPQGGREDILLASQEILPEIVKGDSFAYTVLNPRYIENLEMETTVTTKYTGTVTKKVPVIQGQRFNSQSPSPINTPELEISNPLKYPEFLENGPATRIDPVKENAITVESPISNAIYKMMLTTLSTFQMDPRIVFDEAAQQFKSVDDTNPDFFYSENSAINLLPNAAYYGDKIPLSWGINAPSIVFNSNIYISQTIPTANVWKVRLENTSIFSAFTQASLKMNAPASLPSNINHFSVSAYYRLKHDIADKNKNLFLKVNFYDALKSPINSATSSILSVNDDAYFNRISATFNSAQIPGAAAYFDLEIILGSLDTQVGVALEVFLPQAEVNNTATSVTLGSRNFDMYISGVVTLKNPLYLKLKTVHWNQGLRGLADSTTAGKEGFKWNITGDKLQLRYYNSVGALVFNFFSSSIVAPLLADITYGVFIGTTEVVFYIDDTVLSVHPIGVFSMHLVKSFYIGGFESAGAALNQPIKDFAIYSDVP